MKRVIHNAVTILSLLCCIAAALAWPRSYYRAWSLGYPKVNEICDITSENGRVTFNWITNSPPATHSGGWTFESRPAGPKYFTPMDWSFFGFGTGHYSLSIRRWGACPDRQQVLSNPAILVHLPDHDLASCNSPDRLLPPV